MHPLNFPIQKIRSLAGGLQERQECFHCHVFHVNLLLVKEELRWILRPWIPSYWCWWKNDGSMTCEQQLELESKILNVKWLSTILLLKLVFTNASAGARKLVCMYYGETGWDVAAKDSANYQYHCCVPIVEISVTKWWPLLVPKKLKRCVANCT